MSITLINKLALNIEQSRAVFSAGKRTLVLAGAGTGKTRVLTGRVCHLVERGVPPGSIQVFTFTNKAAMELRSRLKTLIPERINRKIGAGTFHSFCYRILDDWATQIGYRKGISVLTRQDQDDIIKAICEDLGIKPGPIFKAIKKREAHPDMPLVQDEYRHRIRTYNCIDFDLLQEYTVELLEANPRALELTRQRARHILIDEYQDTDPIQARLVDLLDPKSLFVVGDDYQAIYGFRGADFRLILHFQETYPEADRVILPKNYRSTKTIVTAANRLIEYNEMRTHKDMVSANGRQGDPPEAKFLETMVEEAKHVAKLVQKATSKGVELKDVAILARTNKHILTIIDHGLRPARIPVQAITQERSVWETDTARAFILFFRALNNPRDYQAKAHILNWPFVRVDRKTLIGTRRFMALNDLDLYAAAKETVQGNPGLMPFLESFWGVEASLQTGRPDAYELAMMIDQEIGIQNTLHTMRLRSRLRELNDFLHRTRIWVQERKYEEPVDTKAFIAYTVSLSLQDAIRDEASAVKAMTVHAAKGLEFPAVIVAGCVEGLFPHAISLKDGEIEEERRLFYVACTRAMDTLYLSGFNIRSPEAWERRQLPVERSRFVAEALGQPQIH